MNLSEKDLSEFKTKLNLLFKEGVISEDLYSRANYQIALYLKSKEEKEQKEKQEKAILRSSLRECKNLEEVCLVLNTYYKDKDLPKPRFRWGNIPLTALNKDWALYYDDTHIIIKGGNGSFYVKPRSYLEGF